MINQMSKILLISDPIPPMVSSVAVILGRIFKMFTKDSLFILTGRLANSQYGSFEKEPSLDCEYFYADLPKYLAKYRQNRRFSSFYDLLRIPLMIWKGCQIVRSKRINKIITTTYGGTEIAAYFISRLARIPLYIYLFDAYVESEQEPFKKLLRRIFARRFFRSASKIFVMSESLDELLKERYGVNSIVIPQPVEISKYEMPLQTNTSGKRKIVYTGMIYDAHRDCILDLIRAIRDLPDVELHIYTPRPVATLEREGVHGHNVKVSFTPHHAVPAVQKGADILFLPMSFNSPYPEVIRTASPGKISEYLAAGKPILVYAPDYAYVSWYARQHSFGLVVDTADPAELQKAILRLLSDYCLREELVQNAHRILARHEAKSVFHRFQEYLEM